MDKSASTDLTRLRQKLVLPMDVTMVPAKELDKEVKRGIPHSETDIVVTRSNVRSTSKVVDEKLSLLLQEFREPVSITDAVIKFTSGDRSEAESVLEDFLPIAIDLIGVSFLIFETELDSIEKHKTLDPGTQFRQFTIIKCIQSLNQEAVYQARDTKDNFCALKIINRKDGDKNNRKKTQIETEIAILGELINIGCDSTVSFLDCGEEDNLQWIATHWVQGVPISAVAQELRQFNDIEGLHRLAVNVADSYAKLHMSGFLHGDVHPGNILVTNNAEVKLVDFGFSQKLSQPRTAGIGVSFYTEPEVAKAFIDGNRPPLSSESGEQFSVAALIFELLSGDKYQEFNLEQSEMFKQIANAKPIDFVLPHGSRWQPMEDCLKRALSVEKNKRFSNMSEFSHNIASCELTSMTNKTNGYARQNKATHDQLSKFVQTSLDDLPSDVEKFVSDLTIGPTCSLSGGAAGVSYALYRFACLRSSAPLHSAAERWIKCAERHQLDEYAYHSQENAEQFSVVDPCSVHHGASGITFVQCLLAASISDLYGAEVFAERFLEAAVSDTTVWDTTLGKLSVVLACSEMLSTAIDTPAQNSTLVTKADSILQSVWTELQDSPILSSGANIGFSHGTVGLIYTTILMDKFTNSASTYPIYDALSEFFEKVQPVGRGNGFPWRNENAVDLGMMGGWCNGSAGAVFLFAAMYEHDSNPEWINKVEQFAWHVWESDGGIYDLCCGSAGRIYSLLRAYQITGDSQWIKRAELIGKNAIGRVHSDDAYPPWSLFKGRLGLALAIEALTTPEEASMPTMGIAV